MPFIDQALEKDKKAISQAFEELSMPAIARYVKQEKDSEIIKRYLQLALHFADRRHSQKVLVLMADHGLLQ